MQTILDVIKLVVIELERVRDTLSFNKFIF